MALSSHERAQLNDMSEKVTQVHTIMLTNLMPAKEDHDKRIRAIEGNQLKAVGALGLLTFMINGALAWLRH